MVQLDKNGKSYKEMGKIFHRSHPSIQNVVAIYKETGRKKINGTKVGCFHNLIRRIIQQDDTVIGVNWESNQTVRNYLQKLGLRN